MAEPTSARSRLARGSALLVMTGVLAGTVGALTAAPAEAVSGTAAGRVFRDFNMNGAFDATSTATSPAVDTGLSGVTVRAFDRDNNAVATAQTGADGRYTLSYNTSTATANVRLEFDVPTGMVASRAGTAGATNDTDVQFVSTGVTNADLGLVFPHDYSPVNPLVAFTRQVGAVKIDGSAMPVDAGTVFSNLYGLRGAGAGTKEATVAQTGSVWGIAGYRDTHLFSSAVFKRHAALGVNGLGGIYRTTIGGVTDAAPFATVANAGTNPRPTSMTNDQYFNDPNGYAGVGKIGLGGMTIAPDDSALYVVNLNTKALVRIALTVGADGVPVAGAQTSVAIPSPACNGTLRPYGVSSADGALWVTTTCTGPAAADLKGHVYRFDPSTATFGATPAFSTPALNYARGNVYLATSAAWNPWTDSTAVFANANDALPQPMLSDVTFDAAGNMVIGIKDRFGDMTGKAGVPTAGSATFEDGYAAGDLLRACVTPTRWTIENAGSCGGVVGAGKTGTGPGGDAFYNDTYTGGATHDQVTLGGQLQVPGFPQVVSTVYDPQMNSVVESIGYRFYDNATGGFDNTNGYRRVSNNGRDATEESQFGKAGGIGDLDTLVKVPVEIGNRVWIDTDRDGVQEPGEPAVAGVQVTLLNAAGTVVGTTTTATDGTYYFNDANVTGGLVAGAAYRVRLERASDFATGGALFNYVPTALDAGSKDKIDSDAAIASGFPQISLTAPRFGGDHSYDFGFVREAVSVGDLVFVDLDKDGVQDAADPGIQGVVVTVKGPGGVAVTDVFGNAVTTATTDATGKYTFANLPSLAAGQSYTVSIDNAQPALAAFVPTLTGQGNTATDSSTGSAASGDLVNDKDADTKLDFGFVRKSVSVGDYVFVDADRDGVQDATEVGLQGVTVTLVGPNGLAVTDVNGNPVGPVVTNPNGKYTFADLPVLAAGQSYTVKVDNTQAALADYVPTLTGQGTAATDSANGTAVSGPLTANGASDTTLDFGFVREAVSVGDYVFLDLDRDGVQDAGDTGIQGVTVTITRTDGAVVRTTAGAAVTSTTTNAAGAYLFGNLEALPTGTSYRVAIDNAQTALAGLVPTLAGAGTAATDSSTGSATSGALTTNGASDLTLDFGFVRPAVSVGDFVFVDTDKDGIQDAGEPGLSGVTVTLVGPNGLAVTNVNGAVVGPVTTGANGQYTFALLPTLPAGQSYTVKIDNNQAALADYVSSPVGAGTPATDSSNGSAVSGNLTTNGNSDTTLDFGFFRKSVSVGDFVFIDSDRDGIQDAGEPGIQGVVVTITRTDNALVRTVGGTTVTSTTTGAAGGYLFANLEALPAGVFYKTSVDNAQAALAAYVPTLTGQGNAANDSSTGSATSGALTTNGASDLTLDFGFVRPAVSVGDYVFIDADRDGVQDATEVGLAGVTVTIVGPNGLAVTNVNGAVVGPVTTGANGQYTFGLLPALPLGQSYTVKVDNGQAALADYAPTLTGQGTALTDSSNGSAVSGPLTNDGNSDTSLDFGFVKKAVSVGDYVFLDTDRDGVQDAGDTGIQGVVVTITRTDGAVVRTTTGSTVTSTTTNAAGAYLFGNLEALPAGTHYVTRVDNAQAALTAYVPTVTGQGNATNDSSTGSAESVDLTTNGASDLTLDFGFVRPAVSVGDFVFADTNANGIQNAGEPGIAGVTVTIVGPNGLAVTNVNGAVVGPVTTGANGQYTFALLPTLPAGQSYTVKIDNNQAALADYVPTLTGQGTALTDSSNGSATSGNLTTNGASDTSLDFGFVRESVSVGDFVWIDTNRNGVQNAGEPGIQGVVVTITRTDGATVRTVAGATVTSTTTNAAGAYLFTNLETLPAGTHYVTRVDNAQAALTAYVPTLTGQGTAATDSSTSSAESTDLTADGASDLTLDFGFVRPAVSVGDFVFVDTDKDGIQDAGEPGLSGVTVTLVGPNGLAVTNVNGAVVGPVTTGANGQYTFALLPTLPAGQSYTVKIDNNQAALADYVSSPVGAGTPATDSSNGSAVSGNLTTNGNSDTTLDFGFFRKSVSVGDFVFIDSDRDGIQDTGEPGIQGVVVTITRTDNALVRTVGGTTVTSTTTGAAGGYLFANLEALPAGVFYKTSVDNAQAALAAYVPTLTGQGNAANDSSTGSATSGALTTNGASDLTLDFGFVRPAVSVGDYVFIDANGNGIQDAGDTGLQGVRLTIVGPGGQPVTDVNGTVVGAATSGANGQYTFDLLPVLAAGQSYTVRVDNAQTALLAYVPTLTGQGTAATDSSNGSAASAAPLTTNGASDRTLDFGFRTAAPAIELDKTGSAIDDVDGNGPDAGDRITYGFRVTNTGNVVLNPVTVADPKVGPVTCPTGPLAVGASVTCTPVVYTLTQADVTAGAVNNTATAEGTSPGGVKVTDQDTVTTPVNVLSVSVGDVVFLDTDRDGIQDAGEPGIAGVTLTLVGPNGLAVTDVNGTTVGAKVTNANGQYAFANLPALPAGQAYTVRVDNAQAALNGFVPTLTGQGTPATDSSNGSATSGNLTTNGASDLTLDFGFVRPAVSVGDYVFVDANGNGIQDAGDTGLQGVRLTIVGPGGNPVTDVNGTLVGAATSGANGQYTFDLLPVLAAGQSYTVRVDNAQTALLAYVPTLTGQGTAATDSSNGSAASAAPLTTNGASDRTLDFGFKAAGPALSLDKTASAIDDVDGNGPDAGDRITYGFRVTNTGNVVLNPVTVADPKVGPVTCPTTALAVGASVTCTPVVYTLTQADVTAGAVNNTATATGTAPNGLKVTDDDSTTTPIAVQKVRVGDVVFLDTDRDGIQDAGENGIAGVRLTLVGPGGAAVTDVLGDPVGPATTDAAGRYTFSDLPALATGQSYTVRVDNAQAALAAFVPTITGQGTPATDSSTGSAASGNLTTDGASDLTLDFGFVKPAVKVGDTVFADTNGNGVQNAGEPGIPGVTVTIVGPGGQPVTDVNGDPVGPQVTDSTGGYLFPLLPTLPAGQAYTVKVDPAQPALAGYAPTNDPGATGPLTTNGASDLTLDFGFNKSSVSVGDRVFVDTNGNGVQDAGEPGLAGVRLTIVGPGGQPVTGVNGTVVGAVTTDGTGAYTFAGLPTLPAGQGYTVKVDGTQVALNGYTPAPTGQGTPATDSSTGSATSGDLTTPGASDKTLDFGFVRDNQPGVANLKVTKAVDKATPAVGDVVTYTLTVTNDGDAAANNVVLKDVLPSQVTFVSADAPCTQASGTVSCDLGTLAAGQTRTVTIKARVDNVPAGTTEERHTLDVQKAEVVLDVEAGQTGTASVTCPTGYTVLDGSARVVSSGADVVTTESRATSLTTWTATLVNQGTQRAQNKVFALCVANQTETVNGHSHLIQVSPAAVTQTAPVPAGSSDVTLSCAAGQTPVQPGWKLDGAADVQTSYPSGASSWTFGVVNEGAATSGLFSIRCLKNQVSTVNGHSHDLALAELFRTVTVPAGQSVDVVLDCADSALGNQGAKGIVAGFDLPAGLLSLGHEPQPIRRVYTLSNTTSGPLDADLWLLCLGTRTAGHDGSGDVVNTASVTTTSPERTVSDNVASARFRVTATAPAPVDKADLAVTKTVDDTTPRVGDTVTYTLRVTNNGDTAAADVVLTDALPSGISFGSATAPCTLNGSTVRCELGSLAPGATKTVTINATVDAAPSASSSHDHYLDVQKVEQHVALTAGETRTVTVDCAPGYLATDGSGRIDQIDQGTGTADAVRIIRSAAADEDSWAVTMVNTATGNAQGKAFVVCTKKVTDVADGHTHDVVASAPVAETRALTPGATTVTLTCATGRPIAPSYSVPADASVRETYPVGTDGWAFTVDAASAGSADFSIRCLETKVATADGHQHDLVLTPLTQTTTVAPGQTVEITSTCAGDAKGVVAGFQMDLGLVQLGNDPRPIIRVFRFHNPTSSPLDVDVFLLCLTSKTSANSGSGTVVNTAYATTSTPETTTGNNTASVSFKVDTSAPAPVASPASPVVTVAPRQAFVSTAVKCSGTVACTGTAVLVAAKTQRVAGKLVRKGTVLAKATYKVTSGRTATVKMRPSAFGKKVLASKTVKTAQVKVGGKTRTVTIRR